MSHEFINMSDDFRSSLRTEHPVFTATYTWSITTNTSRSWRACKGHSRRLESWHPHQQRWRLIQLIPRRHHRGRLRLAIPHQRPWSTSPHTTHSSLPTPRPLRPYRQHVLGLLLTRLPPTDRLRRHKSCPGSNDTFLGQRTRWACYGECYQSWSRQDWYVGWYDAGVQKGVETVYSDDARK